MDVPVQPSVAIDSGRYYVGTQKQHPWRPRKEVYFLANPFVPWHTNAQASLVAKRVPEDEELERTLSAHGCIRSSLSEEARQLRRDFMLEHGDLVFDIPVQQIDIVRQGYLIARAAEFGLHDAPGDWSSPRLALRFINGRQSLSNWLCCRNRLRRDTVTRTSARSLTTFPS